MRVERDYKEMVMINVLLTHWRRQIFNYAEVLKFTIFTCFVLFMYIIYPINWITNYTQGILGIIILYISLSLVSSAVCVEYLPQTQIFDTLFAMMLLFCVDNT